MDKALRPADKYWASNGVYLGATTGYHSPDDMIVPWYGVLTVGPGHRELLKGAWAFRGGSGGTDPGEVGDSFALADSDVRSGRLAAAVLVCLLSHPDEGEDYPPVVTVVDLSIHPSVSATDTFDPLPGIHSIRDRTVEAYRRANKLDPAKFVRSDPTPTRPESDDTQGEEPEHSGEVPHNPAYGP